jgi:CTP:molybdopterin cytidylyltransferase MocA
MSRGGGGGGGGSHSVVAAVLLAAGGSRRMGSPKPLLPYPPGPDAEPLVRRVARALAEGGARPVVVVVAPGDVGAAVAGVAADLPDVTAVVNERPERGMLSSVQAGLRRARGDGESPPAPAAVVVCPCDLPRLRADHVAAVLEAWDGDAGTIVAPAFAGARGHPTLFGRDLFSDILALDPLKYGLNEVLKRRAERVQEIPVRDDAVLRDADTPEEWAALLPAAAAPPAAIPSPRRVKI